MPAAYHADASGRLWRHFRRRPACCTRTTEAKGVNFTARVPLCAAAQRSAELDVPCPVVLGHECLRSAMVDVLVAVWHYQPLRLVTEIIFSK
jgi:hypothetical protein